MKFFLIIVLLATGIFATSLAYAQSQPQPKQVPKLPSWLEYKTPYAGEENNIANPHRTRDEITSWAQQVAADSLSFSKVNYKIKLKSFKKYFVKKGWQLYAAYLKETKLINMVVDDGYTVGTIVNELPEITNKGTFGSVYHWVVKMPITISFFNSNTQKNSEPYASGKYFLSLDIGRVANGNIAVMGWNVEDMPVKR